MYPQVNPQLWSMVKTHSPFLGKSMLIKSKPRNARPLGGSGLWQLRWRTSRSERLGALMQWRNVNMILMFSWPCQGFSGVIGRCRSAGTGWQGKNLKNILPKLFKNQPFQSELWNWIPTLVMPGLTSTNLSWCMEPLNRLRRSRRGEISAELLSFFKLKMINLDIRIRAI